MRAQLGGGQSLPTYIHSLLRIYLYSTLLGREKGAGIYLNGSIDWEEEKQEEKKMAEKR